MLAPASRLGQAGSGMLAPAAGKLVAGPLFAQKFRLVAALRHDTTSSIKYNPTSSWPAPASLEVAVLPCKVPSLSHERRTAFLSCLSTESLEQQHYIKQAAFALTVDTSTAH
jgi:hypothetical protein